MKRAGLIWGGVQIGLTLLAEGHRRPFRGERAHERAFGVEPGEGVAVIPLAALAIEIRKLFGVARIGPPPGTVFIIVMLDSSSKPIARKCSVKGSRAQVQASAAP